MVRRFTNLGAAVWLLASAWVAAAPPASLEAVDVVSAKRVHWQTGAHQASVFVFLSPQCPCSRDYEPVLGQLARKHPQVRFIGIVSNAKQQAVGSVQSHFRQSPLAFEVVSEAGTAWADAFGALNTPHAFVVDASGRVVYQGGVGDSRRAESAQDFPLAQALAAISAGKQPPVAMARALGCAIRR